MSKTSSRRGFLGASAAVVSSLANPGLAAAQGAGVKPADLPDLTIKEVRVYNIAVGRGSTQMAGIVTNSGIEGNYSLAARYWHPNWSNLGWLEYAKRTLLGKSVLDLPALTSQWKPELRRLGQLSYASAIDNCLWDALGKAVNLPVYRILGAYRDKVKAYASTQHHATIEEFVTEVKLIQSQGFTAYKIHPPSPNGGHDYKLDIEVAKAVRKAAGDDFILLNDPVGVYTREEAFKVGRVLQELDYVCYEDPIPTDDIDGLVQLNQALDIPIHIGEFIFSPYNYAEYIRRGAMDVVRFIVDNVGGITGGNGSGRWGFPRSPLRTCTPLWPNPSRCHRGHSHPSGTPSANAIGRRPGCMPPSSASSCTGGSTPCPPITTNGMPSTCTPSSHRGTPSTTARPTSSATRISF